MTLPFRYRAIFFISTLSVLLEQTVICFWKAFSIVILAAALALLQVPLYIGVWGHLGLLIVLFTAFVFFFVQGIRRFKRPTRLQIEKKIERLSNLEHRPLALSRDTQALIENTAANALWQVYQSRIQGFVKKAKIVWPSPRLADHDKYALRFIVLLLLVTGLSVAGRDSLPRLSQAITPDIPEVSFIPTLTVDLWLEPPAYTGHKTVFLKSSSSDANTVSGTVTVPEDTLLKARISGGYTAPDLSFSEKSLDLVAEADGKNHTLETALSKSGDLNLSYLWRKIGHWYITIQEDMPPQISLIQTPETQDNGDFRLSYAASDDYGLTELVAIVTPAAEVSDTLGKEELELRMPVPTRSNQTNIVHSTHNLSWHPWAGLPVNLHLKGTDSAGHIVTTDPVSFALPERDFQHPLARALIKERKDLVWKNEDTDIRGIAQNILTLGNQPAAYKGDIVVFMGLASAAKRLVYNTSDNAVPSVIHLLWDIALRVEDGSFATASRDMQSALQNMSDVLNDPNASKEDVQKAMDELQAAMQDYLAALQRDMAARMKEQGQDMPQIPPEIAEKMMQKIDIGQLIRDMQNMAQANSKEDLQEMLNRMQNMVQNLDPSRIQKMQEAQARAMQTLAKIQEITKQQQELMAKTSEQRDGQNSADIQKQQQDLRRELGDTMIELSRMVDEIPQSLGKAEQAMGKAARELGGKRPSYALPHQKEAIEELQKGMDNAMNQMAGAMRQQIISLGFMPSGGKSGNKGYGKGYDPLGREQASDESDVIVPDEQELRRVQQIINELRQKSGDYRRPPVERDYIDRLLRQF